MGADAAFHEKGVGYEASVERRVGPPLGADYFIKYKDSTR